MNLMKSIRFGSTATLKTITSFRKTRIHRHLKILVCNILRTRITYVISRNILLWFKYSIVTLSTPQATSGTPPLGQFPPVTCVAQGGSAESGIPIAVGRWEVPAWDCRWPFPLHMGQCAAGGENFLGLPIDHLGPLAPPEEKTHLWAYFWAVLPSAR